MPEGPSIFLIKETIAPIFTGKKIKEVSGNARIDINSFKGQKVEEIRTWGKHLLICLTGCTIRVHFLLFGSYSLDVQTKQDRSVRLMLSFGKRKIFFYTCAVKILEEDMESLYDWSVDLLDPRWNPARARKKVKELPASMVCDLLLDQNIFAGSGNIIKNEVLYRIRLHPETRVRNLPPAKLNAMVREARNYSFDFLKWKREFTLKKHWLAHTKKICQRCDQKLIKKYCGRTKRRSFFCTNCQVKY